MAAGSTQQQIGLATSLLQKRDLRAAEAVCRDLLTQSPDNPIGTHLLGLVRKEAGDLQAGEQLIRRSIELQPHQAEFRTNLANLLRRSNRNREAVVAYTEALQVDPRHRSAHIGLARTLNDLGEHSAAEQRAQALLSLNRSDPLAWSLLAMALRDQLRLEEAEAAYRKALELSPNDARTHHNLGAVLAKMERAEDAMRELAHAEVLGVSGFELAFNRGLALLQLYRIEEAEQAFAESVQHNPLHAEAQVNLARVRYMRGDADFARGLRIAAAAHQNDANLQVLFALLLRRAGDLRGAESLLRDSAARFGPAPEIRTALAEVLLEQGRLQEAEIEALEAIAARPYDQGVADVLVTILLCRRRPEDAMPFIRTQRLQHPESQGWIAYQATAARLLGDPLYEQLYDYSRFVQTYDLESPPGYSSMNELNAVVLEALNERHRFSRHPLDQSLRNGSQTARSLFADPDPHIRQLLSAFELPIQEYLRALGANPEHPLCKRNTGRAKLTGAWSVQLRRDGFHVNHVHPQGWISSAYYVSVPAEVADENLMSGWIKFGETRYPVPGASAEGVVQPRAGRLVLFPSYMWHGTNPIYGSEPRTTIAFDAVPTASLHAGNTSTTP